MNLKNKERSIFYTQHIFSKAVPGRNIVSPNNQRSVLAWDANLSSQIKKTFTWLPHPCSNYQQ